MSQQTPPPPAGWTGWGPQQQPQIPQQVGPPVPPPSGWGQQPPAAPPEPRTKAWISRHKVLTAIIGIFALIVIGSAAASTSGNNPKKSNDAATTGTSPSASQPPTQAASETPTPTPTTPPKTSAAAPVAPAAVTYKGRGDKLLKIAKPEAASAALVTIVGRGSSSNFAVTSLDSSLQQIDLLVNTIGAYSGTTLLDKNEGDETARLKIEYPGSWTVVIRPISAAPEFSTKAAGKGDRVYKYFGDAQGLKITNKGEGNFAVTTYGDAGDLLVNEIGNYSGEVALGAGPEVIQIESDGLWTMTATG